MRSLVFVCCTVVLALKCIVVLGQAPAGCTDQQVYVASFMLPFLVYDIDMQPIASLNASKTRIIT